MARSISGALIQRNYSQFRGVDFSNRKDDVSLYRSPDALNMWKNYKNSNGRCVETRPDLELLKEFSNTIYGLFFYTINGAKHTIVHSGTNLYDNDFVVYTKMAERKTNFFVFNNNLYIKDGVKYLVYNGEELKEVEGYIPTTSISRNPAGGGKKYQDVNLLTGIRKNTFVGDDTSTEYFLDVEDFDEDYEVKAWVFNEDEKKDIEVTEFETFPNDGKIVFTTAPKSPDTDGKDNVTIQFRRTIGGYRDRIDKCTIVEKFDNRVFFSGNPDYPNFLWHSSLNDPTYCSDLDYYVEGTTESSIKSIVAGNNALWVMKEPSQNNTTIFYHNPTIDGDYGKVYPSTHSSISTGCVARGINFNDDICFFSERGMEAISGDVTTEQVLAHRSTMVDNKLLNLDGYKDLLLEEWAGYLFVIVGSKVFLADSREMVQMVDHNEYEFFYWDFKKDIKCTLVNNNILYLCTEEQVKENGVLVTKHRIYTLTNTKDTREVESYWITLDDEFNYPQYQKTTNKKGCVVDLEGEKVTISARTSNGLFDIIDTYKNVKGYVVARIKKKKWKSIQLRFSSDKPFYLYSATLESWVGSYLKR